MAIENLQSLVTLRKNIFLKQLCDVLLRDGGVIIENFVEQGLVDRMNARIQPYIDKEDIDASLCLDMPIIGDQEENLMTGKTYRIWGLLGKMPEEISAIMQHPIWAGVMDNILSQDTEDFYATQMTPSRSSYTLNIANSFTIHPGAERQSLHRDQRAQMIEPDGTGFTSMVTCLIAGTNATKRNGSTMVVKGSHLWGKERFALPSEAVPAEMSKGSALIFLGSIFHGAGANTSEPGSLDSVRQLFAVVKNLPEDVLKHTGWRRNIAGSGFVKFQEPFDMIDKLPLLSRGDLEL